MYFVEVCVMAVEGWLVSPKFSEGGGAGDGGGEKWAEGRRPHFYFYIEGY